jgi:hypothetical protein
VEEIVLYRVCPHRNIEAAFQRFLGADSGGIDRFFVDRMAVGERTVAQLARGLDASAGLVAEWRFEAARLAKLLRRALKGAQQWTITQYAQLQAWEAHIWSREQAASVLGRWAMHYRPA